jgi:hypothetical protein
VNPISDQVRHDGHSNCHGTYQLNSSPSTRGCSAWHAFFISSGVAHKRCQLYIYLHTDTADDPHFHQITIRITISCWLAAVRCRQIRLRCSTVTRLGPQHDDNIGSTHTAKHLRHRQSTSLPFYAAAGVTLGVRFTHRPALPLAKYSVSLVATCRTPVAARSGRSTTAKPTPCANTLVQPGGRWHNPMTRLGKRP